MWPTEVRGDLREALKAKYKADLSTSAAFLERYAIHPTTHHSRSEMPPVLGKQPKHYPLSSSYPSLTSKLQELPSV